MNPHSWAIAPVLEDNSGLLSLMALALALAIAVYQHGLAKRAEAQRRSDFVDLADGLIKTAIYSAEQAMAATDQGNLDAAANQFAKDKALVCETLEAIRSAAPPDAALILTVTGVIAELRTSRWDQLALVGPTQTKSLLTTLVGRLRQLNAEIASRRPV